MKSIVNLFSGILLLFSLASCNNFGKIQKSKDFQYKLVKADEYFEKKKYNYAQQLYEELFPVYKGTPKFEDIYYKYAYCFYYLGMYSNAENLFKGYLEVFPNSKRAEEIDYMRAYSYYKQSPKIELEQVNTLKAMSMMQTFISTHPGSARIKEATKIIDEARAKLEIKDYRAAGLYYNLGHYRGAALAFADLLNNYPESLKGEEYKLMVVKSYFKFAKLSVEEKQIERFEKVVNEYQDFEERYPESKFLKEAKEISLLSNKNIKAIQNEQTTSPTGR